MFEVDNTFVTEPKDIVESFNNYYSHVAKNLDASLGPSNTDPMSYMSDVTAPGVMSFSNVSEEYVRLLVSNLKNVGAGLDGINVKMFKLVLPSILKELTHLVNICISKSVFPSNLTFALLGGGCLNTPPPCGFSRIARKRRRAAPPGFHLPYPPSFWQLL